ncbi:hypothetical protein [Staphylococcus pseudintermedius]
MLVWKIQNNLFFLTVQMLKGGVGKSVIAYNFMMYLAIEKQQRY